ncbi:MAG: hypothetical protein KGD64_12595, partial [Candidatus Heimdallarchaeota archaeon]|nr:hypothetical protein [Candidatus Heimdallarchaeota archaeon]
GINDVRSYDIRDEDNLVTEMLKEVVKGSGLKVLHLKVEEDSIKLDNIPHHPVDIHKNFIRGLKE